MLHKKWEYILYSFYDRTGIETHLEKMAAKGWMLEKMGRSFWTYHRMEPRAMHFSIVYFAPASEFDCAPGEEQQTFQDYCAEAGWTLAASWSQMLIFASDAEAPTPIETDAAVQLDTIHRAMKRNFLIAHTVLLALALFQLIRDVSDLWNHPTDSLANPALPFVLFCWAMITVLCVVEITAYLLWRRRALRAAEEEGRFTPTPSLRGFRRVCFALLLPSAALWLLSLGTGLALIGVGAILVVAAAQLVIAGIKGLMKRTGRSAAINRAVTLIAGFLLTCALFIGFDTWGARLLRDPPGRETYTWQGDEYDVQPIPLPLTMEDLTDQPYEHVSREQRETRTFFLARHGCRETVGLPQKQVSLYYEVTDILRPRLRDTVVRDRLENDDLVGYIGTRKLTLHRTWLPEEDPGAWGADAVYRRYLGKEQRPSSQFLLFYGDRMVETELAQEPTDSQQALVGARLGCRTS